MIAHARVPCAKLGFIQRIVQAEHRRGVRHFYEAFARRAANPLA